MQVPGERPQGGQHPLHGGGGVLGSSRTDRCAQRIAFEVGWRDRDPELVDAAGEKPAQKLTPARKVTSTGSVGVALGDLIVGLAQALPVEPVGDGERER